MIYPKPQSAHRCIDNLMVEKLGVRSDIREWYFAFFRSLLICMLYSNPTVSSRIKREVSLTSTRSGLRESQETMLGDTNEGRSAYNEHKNNNNNDNNANRGGGRM